MFAANGTTSKTISVEHGYILTDSDYPTVPAKVGYTGAWNKYTEPVTQDITVEAVYTINQYKVTFTANGTIVKTMTVDYGYTLKNADYPAVPIVNGKTGQWTRYTKPITRNITITATYSDAGINPPVKPPIETSSIDGAASNNGKVKEIITARHTYIYTGGQLAQETITTTVTPADGTSTPTGDILSSGESSATATLSGNIGNTATASNGVTTTETLYYAYDANGVPMSLTYTAPDSTTTTYYYATNIQGDVTAILDTTGTAVVEYTYDAWGNLLTTTGSLADTLGKLNSLRYRGYVYDVETELYYVSSRYYNSEVGRFINADISATLTAGLENFVQYNLFAYCFNNPVNLSDTDGTWPSWATKIAIGVGAILVGATVVALTAATGGAAAAFIGAAAAGLKTAAIAGIAAAGTSSIVTAGMSLAAGDDAKTILNKTASAARDGFADGFMWGGISFGASHAAGYVTNKTGIFKRDVTYGKDNFMYGTSELTIWRHGPNFRIDASATRGLHYHLRTETTGIGKHRTRWIPEIIGAISGLVSIIFH